jgi:transposase
VITDPTRMNEILVGLPDVNVLGLIDEPGEPVEVVIELHGGPVGCPSCGVVAEVKDRDEVVLVDLPCFGRCARLRWRKRRFRCREDRCPTGSFSEENRELGSCGTSESQRRHASPVSPIR